MQKLLIANRGEIALRVIRTCKEMGIATVAPYARVDKALLHLRYADETICISEVDYLSRESFISAALVSGCDMVHPGYGFLSEDSMFCRMVEQNDLMFIGPTEDQIASMGNKANARAKFNTLGLQSVPGSCEAVSNLKDALNIAREVGFPVLIKAAFGGGGRGIRVVEDESSCTVAFAEAQSEASSVFSDSTVYIEKFLDNARHIEVQVLGDGHGEAIHLGTRECSIQRRQQKVIEEAPAPNIPRQLLDNLCDLAVSAVRKMKYRNAGTLEFLYQDGEFYFLEMNTRIQVEHAISEMITGVDIVRLQIETAVLDRLTLTQADVIFSGCAMECRLNAEDDEYRPCPGVVSNINFPAGPGVRVDSHLYNGYRIPHQFDSLIAKLVALDTDRDRTVQKMRRMMDELSIEGVDTNRNNLIQVISSDQFRKGDVHTGFLDQLKR